MVAAGIRLIAKRFNWPDAVTVQTCLNCYKEAASCPTCLGLVPPGVNAPDGTRWDRALGIFALHMVYIRLKKDKVREMYIGDLHIHSRYSRATSKDGTPEYLDLWARKKGIQIVGTGDFTHPAWREELKEKLEPAEDGLYTLKKEYRISDFTAAAAMEPRFVISGEISSIYKKNDKVRKVHSLILLPGLEEAEELSKRLERIGNIHSDGRPILGLDCRDLLEILLETCPEAVYVPAHIWTPHFSLFGAFSGFDTVEECFEDLSSYVKAMETGLSSDPPMNWRISALDKYQLISNSDAHSPAKLGREANLLDIELSYQGLRDAIQEGKGLAGTIEFFPEEGKYHFDGHRKCHLCLSPVEAEKYGGKCPVCGRKLTTGVSHRVEQMADRPEGYVPGNPAVFESLVPLPEVIGASLGHSAASVKVLKQYEEMLGKLGTEFEILRKIPVEDIRKVSGYLISEGIRRLREGKVERIPGFDGEYGIIRLFNQWEIENTNGQISFFDTLNFLGAESAAITESAVTAENNSKVPNGKHTVSEKTPAFSEEKQRAGEYQLNSRQQEAVCAVDRAIAVIAGPGTGKTKTLVSRILYLLETRRVKPSEIAAVTFTNKAAREMRERLERELGKKSRVKNMKIGTFHSLCLEYLKEKGLEFMLADESETLEIAREVIKECRLDVKPKQFLQEVSLRKSGMPEAPFKFNTAMDRYQRRLQEHSLLDFDDLLLETLKYLEAGGENAVPEFPYLLADEFQDINPVQYRLLTAWNAGGKELFVIGDSDQSIYGFRGSDAECFGRLKEDFPQMKVVQLEENYRSSPQIVDSASGLISHNPGGERVLHANCKDGVKVRISQAKSNMGEAIFVAKEINRLIGGIDMLDAQEKEEYREERQKTRSFGDIAVLYRTHRQAELLENCLRQEGIPYVVAGRDDFLTEDLVRGCICFFRCLEKPADIQARNLCLKLLWNLDASEISDSIFENMRDKYAPLYKKTKPSKLLGQWMEDMNLAGEESLMKLSGMMVFYKNMAEFIQALSLGVESDLVRCGGKRYSADMVTLMTLHGSKGLEFPVTFIYGVRKGVIPYESKKSSGDTEEERRLFYVGMTRAREELILTTSGEKSPFLEELPEKLVEWEEAGKKRQPSRPEQLSLFDFQI